MNRRALLLLLLSSIPLWQTRAENLDISANGGIGVAERDAFGLRAVPSAGLSIGAAITPRHKFQFDYTVGHMERETASAGGFAPSIHNRHFFTGSYVLQSVRGRVRPSFQIGAGVQRETNNNNDVVNRPLSERARASFAGVTGAGVTIHLTRSVFIRPQVRAYFTTGPTHNINVTAIPSLALGWRF